MSRILGIDYGERRIGLAISDSMSIIAQPLDTLVQDRQGGWRRRLEEILAEQEVVTIVVGYPLTMKGGHSRQTDRVDDFIAALKLQTGLPVDTYDERLTSVAARRALVAQGVRTGHNKGAVDRTAAAIMLQDYLDSRANLNSQA